MGVGLSSTNNLFESFHSPTKGQLTKDDVFSLIEQTIASNKGSFEIIVGADSQLKSRGTFFALVITVIRPGHGGSFFYHKFQEQRYSSLQQRIFQEAVYAVGLATEVRQYLRDHDHDTPVRLHFDIGANGPTRKFIQSLLSLAASNQFRAEIKPHSFCASTIADKFTR
ncbi:MULTISPECIES: ribonuclease H-like YkuK family protein [Brevibacillus]|uniref:ribonuclease H-like YkuK family protein n=1 Tax=Brevibacillus TaxID=55080 RepID=UPI00203CAD11|nr:MULTISPECIES: ribonuclease H-like YkuK family protein [Brevibacillus]MCM3080202.1 ribonuclease H-like YkuK family protein [Brevibacillus invocatus]